MQTASASLVVRILACFEFGSDKLGHKRILKQANTKETTKETVSTSDTDQRARWQELTSARLPAFHSGAADNQRENRENTRI